MTAARTAFLAQAPFSRAHRTRLPQLCRHLPRPPPTAKSLPRATITAPPTTESITRNNEHVAVATLLSSRIAVTAYHAVHDYESSPIAGSSARIMRSCRDADFTFLLLDDEAESPHPIRELPIAQALCPTHGARAVVHGAHGHRAAVRVHGVVMATVTFSGASVPLLQLLAAEDGASSGSDGAGDEDDEDDYDVKDGWGHMQLGPGWSGAAVTFRGELIGIVVQGDGARGVQAVPAPLLRHVIVTAKSDSGLGVDEPLARLPAGLVLQPLVHRGARRMVLCDENKDNDADDAARAGVLVVCGGTSRLAEGDVLLRVDGELVAANGTVAWHGLQAPVAALAILHAPGQVVEAIVWRDGEVIDTELELTFATSQRYIAAPHKYRVLVTEGLLLAAVSTSLLKFLRGLPVSQERLMVLAAALTDGARDPETDVVALLGYESDAGVISFGDSADAEAFTGCFLQRVTHINRKVLRTIEELSITGGDGSDEGGASNEVEVRFENGFLLRLPRGSVEEARVRSGDDGGG